MQGPLTNQEIGRSPNPLHTAGIEHPAGILKRKFENNGHGLIL
jgi:hypothetical protein